MSKVLANKNFYSNRACLVIRDIIIGVVSEYDEYNDSLFSALGLDECGFNFIKNSGSEILYKLSERLCHAEAVKINVNNQSLCKLIRQVENHNDCTNISFDVKLITTASVYQSLKITKNILSLIADSPCKFLADLINIDKDLHKSIHNLSAIQLDVLSLLVAGNKCLQLSFDAETISSRLISVMEYKRKEGIKDLLLSKKATTHMMSYLFPEENKLKVQTRRDGLGAKICVGRPVTLSSEEMDTLIRLWIENYKLSELDKFLLIHRTMRIDFDRIWNGFNLAKEEGHFDPELIKTYQNRKSLACQID